MNKTHIGGKLVFFLKGKK